MLGGLKSVPPALPRASGIIEIFAALSIIFATVASLDQIINRGDAQFPWQKRLAFVLQVFAALDVL